MSHNSHVIPNVVRNKGEDYVGDGPRPNKNINKRAED